MNIILEDEIDWTEEESTDRAVLERYRLLHLQTDL